MSINPIDFIKAVRARAEAEPDKVYNPPQVWDDPRGELVDTSTCVYVETHWDTLVKSPSCLIGCALSDLGVPLEHMEAHNEVGLYTLNEYISLDLPEDVAVWATRVQNKQDDEHPWGTAVEIADEQIGLPAEYQEVAA